MIRTSIVALLLTIPAHAGTPAACPAAVSAALAKAFPRATIAACKAEHARGKDFVEAKLTTTAGVKIEVDIAGDGTILQVEEPIAEGALPEAVRKAFAARYPRAKVTTVIRQTAGKDVSYELVFLVDRSRKEATFSATGAFVEEE